MGESSKLGTLMSSDRAVAQGLQKVVGRPPMVTVGIDVVDAGPEEDGRPDRDHGQHRTDGDDVLVCLLITDSP